MAGRTAEGSRQGDDVCAKCGYTGFAGQLQAMEGAEHVRVDVAHDVGHALVGGDVRENRGGVKVCLFHVPCWVDVW